MDSISSAGSTLDAKQTKVAHAFYRAALIFGILPTLAGLGILLLFWITEADVFMIAGYFMLLVGAGIVVLGVVFLMVWSSLERELARSADRRFSTTKVWLIGLLLISNFGAGIACAAMGMYLNDRQIVEIMNESGTMIDVCALKINDTQIIPIGPIPAGGNVRRVITHDGDIDVTLDLAQGSLHVNAVVEGYATGGGFHDRVHVMPGLSTRVDHLR